MPKTMWNMRMGQESKSCFNNMTVTAFYDAIMFTRVWARETMLDSKGGYMLSKPAVSDPQLVLQLINGLTGSKLDGVGMMLQQTSPLPDFYTARSRLILEETRQAQQSQMDTALHATTTVPAVSHAPVTSSLHLQTYHNSHTNSDFHRGQSRERGRRGRGRSRVRRNNSSRGPAGPQGTHTSHPPPWMQHYAPWWTQQPWPAPPVPYPTIQTPRGPSPSGNNAGILGPPPSQFYANSEASYAPTSIEQAMHTMTLNLD
ncbi:hypothetical protein E3N88_19574 [Mikania micrantha]|uniref:Uncharacterized protein n=1 Tax=Mikania micrantha TaxID=192012 RepID=A0A5N6NRC6_9ASTR|nr:hypothetical protein E3N88_19574 [Mikania micrantha]